MKRKILLVEDNPATVDIVQTELEFLGYDSTVAENGQKAVDMASTYLPDLIVMDISLPKLGGLEATTIIRTNPKMCTKSRRQPQQRAPPRLPDPRAEALPNNR